MKEEAQKSPAKNIVEFREICKYFPGVRALDRISFRAESGQVYAFVGENGAGKSTLLKILNGDYTMTSGKVLLNGREQHFTCPKDAIEAGISVIYQERQVILDMTVAENVFLGSWARGKDRLIDYNRMLAETRKVIEEFGVSIDPAARVRTLSTAHQQMVEIMKAYIRNAKVIAFDEPTASLTDNEIGVLFRIIRKLRAQGKIVFYVSHRMKELEQIVDRVIVFKDGQLVAEVGRQECTNQDLIRMMVGRDLGDLFQSLERSDSIGETILEVRDLCNYYAKNVSFELHRGEILGFSGLVGAGRTELMRSIYGADPTLSGTVLLGGKKIENRSPAQAIANGIALCPEDRKEQGIIPTLSVGMNISISVLKRLRNACLLIDAKRETQLIEGGIRQFKIRTPNAQKKILELSGGNQQKAVVARAHETNPDVIILDEPTKGIDVGAKSEFYKMICEYARMGKGVILISSELPEIIGLSDRIIVMREGRVTGEVSRKDATEELILQYAMLGGD